MGSIPTSPRSDVLAFAQAHQQVWTTNAAAIGMTPAQATNFKNAVSAYAGLQTQADAATFALRTLNAQTSESYADMRRQMSDAVRSIRAFAELQAKPDTIYALAQIPAPQPAGIAPPPAQPINVAASIIAPSGAIELRWKATNPAGTSGTSYIVRRKLPSESTFTFVGVSGEKRFVDSTFIAGPDSVQYTVQGQRADSAGPTSQVFTLNFGVPGPGGVQSVTVVAEKPKMAA